jgi:hypothetical protein
MQRIEYSQLVVSNNRVTKHFDFSAVDPVEIATDQRGIRGKSLSGGWGRRVHKGSHYCDLLQSSL